MAIVVKTLSEQAYEIIRERILSNDMQPDKPIRQDALSQTLGVSKIPLREALTRLEHDGLLISHPNRGFLVRPLTVNEAEDVFDLRLSLEPDAAAEACKKASDEQREKVKEIFIDLQTMPMNALQRRLLLTAPFTLHSLKCRTNRSHRCC